MSDKKRIILLGATGSIGQNTCKVVARHSDRLEIAGAACDTSYEKLAEIARAFSIPKVAIFNSDAAEKARSSELFPKNTEIVSGMSGLIELAGMEDGDLVVSAVVGTLGLKPTLAAIEAGKEIALASKEILVLAGKFITEAAREQNVRILPIDSEHNALFQCLHGQKMSDVAKLIITASGGAFRDLPLNKLAEVTPEEALEHPVWEMGPKVTVDSATMANKGLELIEAHWLFDVPSDKLEVTIHPQSIVHSLVEFKDGSILSQMSPPSMTFAIQHALLYPERRPGVDRGLDFSKTFSLEFLPVEADRYPCLQLARDAMESGGVAPAIFNAANEVAVDAFLAKQLGYLEIPSIIRSTLERSNLFEPDSLDAVLEADAAARREAQLLINAHV